MTMCTRSRRLWRLAVPLPIFLLLQLLPTRILVSSSPDESSRSRGVPGWVSQPCVGTHRGDTSASCVGHVPLLLISAALAESGLPSLVATDDLSASATSVVVAAATADESPSSATLSVAGDTITSAGAAIETKSSSTALVAAAAPTESSPSSAAAIPSTASSSSSVTSMHLRRLRAVYVHGYNQGAGTSPGPGPGGRPRKLFSWGDFSASIRTSRLQLLITAKMVDHGNGSVSVHFRHNATGRGSVSVSLGPPTVPLCLTPHRPFTSQQQQERQNHHQQQQQCSDNQQWDHNQQNQQQQQQAESKAPRDTEPFRCRVEYEKVDRALKSVPCTQPRRSDPAASLSPGPGIGPGQSAGSVPGAGSSCYREQVQSHVSWICSKPISAFCIYVAFQGTNYRLAHKVCPDLHMVRTPSG